MTTDRAPGEQIKMTVSERDADSLAAVLGTWLTGRLGTSLEINNVRMPQAGGLSSTSVLFEAQWTIDGTQSSGAYVARMAPESSAVPVFPKYDLPGQFELISQVAERCSIPLPTLRWNEPDGATCAPRDNVPLKNCRDETGEATSADSVTCRRSTAKSAAVV